MTKPATFEDAWDQLVDGNSDGGLSDSETDSSTPDEDDVDFDAGASSQDEDDDQEGEDTNPYTGEDAGGSEGEDEGDDARVPDDRPTKNLQAEFARKLEAQNQRFESKIAEMQAASDRQLSKVMQGFESTVTRLASAFEKVTEKPAPDPLSELDPDDPDYELQVMRHELQAVRKEFREYKGEREKSRAQKDEERRLAGHRDWVSGTTTRIVEDAVKGTPFAANNEVKGMLWDRCYTAMASIGGDSSRIGEVIAAVASGKATLLGLSKQDQAAAAKATQTKPASSRKPISGRGGPTPRGTTKKRKSVAEMSDKEFQQGIDDHLDSLFGSAS